MSFKPTPEQLALREARRLKKEKKEKAAVNAGLASTTPPDSLLDNERGHIVPRPWLAVQDSPLKATLPAKIMTWNVRFFFFSPVCTALDTCVISALISLFFSPQLLAQCLVREWRDRSYLKLECELHLRKPTPRSRAFPQQ